MRRLSHLVLLVSASLVASSLIASPAMAARPAFQINTVVVTAGPTNYDEDTGAVLQCYVNLTVTYDAGGRAKNIRIAAMDHETVTLALLYPLVERDGNVATGHWVDQTSGDYSTGLLNWEVNLTAHGGGRTLGTRVSAGSYQYVTGQCPAENTLLAEYP